MSRDKFSRGLEVGSQWILCWKPADSAADSERTLKSSGLRRIQVRGGVRGGAADLSAGVRQRSRIRYWLSPRRTLRRGAARSPRRTLKSAWSPLESARSPPESARIVLSPFGIYFGGAPPESERSPAAPPESARCPLGVRRLRRGVHSATDSASR